MSVYVSRIGAHTVHPIAMKLSQVVVNVPAVVLEIKKKIMYWLEDGCAKLAHCVPAR